MWHRNASDTGQMRKQLPWATATGVTMFTPIARALAPGVLGVIPAGWTQGESDTRASQLDGNRSTSAGGPRAGTLPRTGVKS